MSKTDPKDQIIRDLAALIDKLALIPAGDFYKSGDYAAGLVNDAWVVKNEIVQGLWASSTTVVNAQFGRWYRTPHKKTRTLLKNVQGIVVPLPADQLCSAEFRDHVRAAAPAEDGPWALQGYCIPAKT